MLNLLKSTFVDAMRVFCVLAFALSIVVTGIQLVTNKSPYTLARDLLPKHSGIVRTEPCTDREALNLSGAQNNQIASLETYQRACKSYITGTMMTFAGIPTSDSDAAAEAKQVSGTLKDFAKYHIRPLVMAEPRDYTTDKLVDMGSFAKGDYTGSLSAMFRDMQREGVRPGQMGIWSPFPEANMPEWSDSQPQYFAPDVNTYLKTLEQYFPGTQTSIMLSSASYQPNDTSLKNGQYVSLLPYLKGITPGSIDYAGLEGFPWLPPRGQSGAMLDAGVFLKPSIISEAADYLGTRNIWLNTGTMAAQYTQSAASTASLTPAQRHIILTGIDEQALALHRQGYHVAVNLFAENKSKTGEAVDWSYWNGSDPSGSAATPVLTDFVHTLDQQQIAFWLFGQ